MDWLHPRQTKPNSQSESLGAISTRTVMSCPKRKHNRACFFVQPRILFNAPNENQQFPDTLFKTQIATLFSPPPPPVYLDPSAFSTYSPPSRASPRKFLCQAMTSWPLAFAAGMARLVRDGSSKARKHLHALAVPSHTKSYIFSLSLGFGWMFDSSMTHPIKSLTCKGPTNH